MKRFHKLIGILLSLTMITLISGCGGGGGTTSAVITNNTPTATNTAETSSNTDSGDTSSTTNTDESTGGNVAIATGKGAVAMRITDAATDDESVTGVFVTFTGLRYQYKDIDESVESDEDKGVVIIDENNESLGSDENNESILGDENNKKVKDDESVEDVEDNETLKSDEENESIVNTSIDPIVESGQGWQEVTFPEPIKIDLLTLQNGDTALLHQTILPAGEIQHVRFILDVSECYVELEGNIPQTLTVPSGDQTGYKAIGGFTIHEGGTISVIADFDLRKSVTVTGNGKYILKPTIKIVDVKLLDEIIEVDVPIDDMKTGEINGTMTLDANGSQVIVYAYEDGSWEDNETTAENNFGNSILSTNATDGNYALPWLVEGKYDLIVVANDVTGVFENILGYINNVPVVAGETTEQNITSITIKDAL